MGIRYRIGCALDHPGDPSVSVESHLDRRGIQREQARCGSDPQSPAEDRWQASTTVQELIRSLGSRPTRRATTVVRPAICRPQPKRIGFGPWMGSRRGIVSPSWRWRFLACLLWSRWVPLRSLNKPAPSGPSTPTAGNDQAGGLTTTRPCTRATSRSHKACSSPLRSSQSWCRGRSTFKVAWLNGGTGCSLRSASLRHSFDE
jgi:hypothetical protein